MTLRAALHLTILIIFLMPLWLMQSLAGTEDGAMYQCSQLRFTLYSTLRTMECTKKCVSVCVCWGEGDDIASLVSAPPLFLYCGLEVKHFGPKAHEHTSFQFT